MEKIAVIGSLNMDMHMHVKQFPLAGQTVSGHSFATYYGGKGANQGIASAKLGMPVTMIGAIGDDLYGHDYKAYLENAGIETHLIQVDHKERTGVAFIEVDDFGENRIIVVAGANQSITLNHLMERIEQLLAHDIYLVSLEIPPDFVIEVLKLLKEAGKTIILDPAPAEHFQMEMLEYIDYLTPNETEFEAITGIPLTDEESMREGFEVLAKHGLTQLIIKKGAKGSFWIDAEELIDADAFQVNTIDTVGAGDAFNAGLAYGITHLQNKEDILVFANGVGALSTTQHGAQKGVPTVEGVYALLNRGHH